MLFALLPLRFSAGPGPVCGFLGAVRLWRHALLLLRALDLGLARLLLRALLTLLLLLC